MEQVRSKMFIRSFAREAGRILLIITLIILVCFTIIVGGLLLLSTGKVEPFLDEKGQTLEGSISEKIHVTINGVEQGMFIKGKDKRKPVLLFLHGGPAMPEYTFAQKYPTGLEDCFIVCYWEQRGAGLSYSSDMPPETLTVEQLISDTLEVTNHLRNGFGQEKIYLMGHSGGSFFCIQAAARAPELYHAYIGIAQISNQMESEKLAYKYMMEQYTMVGDKRMIQKLDKFPITEMDTMPPPYRSLRDEAMHSLGIGTMRNMESVVSGIFLPVMQNPEYTFTEKINIWRGKWSVHSTNMWNQILATNLTTEVTKLDIPVYFFSGLYDYTASYTLAKDYLEKLQAPVKGFYTFEQSAHSPIFEEPEKMQHILKEDVLLGVNNLADTK